MAKRPSFQFYPGDWLRDGVAGCSLTSQGLWLRMMFVMHDSENYGEACIGGAPMTDEAIARRCGTTLKTYRKCLQELDNAGVVSRKENGVLFCRRMVRDELERKQAAERQRLSRDRHGDVKEMSRPCHGDVTALSQPSSSSSSLSLQEQEKKEGKIPTGQEKEQEVGPWLRRNHIDGPMASHVLATPGVTVSALDARTVIRTGRAKNPAAAACQDVCTSLGNPIPKSAKGTLSPDMQGLLNIRNARKQKVNA